jgi:transposase
MALQTRSSRLTVTNSEHADLFALAAKRNSPHWLVVRAQIILSLASGLPATAVCNEINVSLQTVSKWRLRWQHTERTDDLQVEALLSDSPRPGAPPKFSAEQCVAIVAIACETPKSHGRPIEQWTHRELRDEAEKAQIVSKISVRQIGRILKESKLQPHRCRYWLTSKFDKDKEEKINDVCETYQSAKVNQDEAYFTLKAHNLCDWSL